MTPYEIIAGPIELWVAPVATAFPKVDATPTGPWVLLGANGSKNQDESGVVLTHNQTITPWRSAGSTVAQKAFRTEESLTIEAKLADLSSTTYAKILNNATVSTTNPTTLLAGDSNFPLKQGSTIALFALLAKGLSPAGDSFSAQYEVPRVYQGASPKPAFVKGAPAMLDVQFMVLEDATLGMGVLRIQTAAHS